jgi:hypothetical protein
MEDTARPSGRTRLRIITAALALHDFSPAAGRYYRARRALDENAIADWEARIDYETPEFLRLNHEVAEAERGVTWWQRALIDWRVTRELDYWNRTGQ